MDVKNLHALRDEYVRKLKAIDEVLGMLENGPQGAKATEARQPDLKGWLLSRRGLFRLPDYPGEVHPKRLRRAVDGLVKKGLIKIKTPGSGRRATVYER